MNKIISVLPEPAHAGFFCGMDLQTQIRQQQSAVQMLEKLVRAKRATQDQLYQAQRRLADLQEQVDFKPVVQTTAPKKEVPVPEPLPSGPRVDDDEYASLQADLSKEADTLNRRMAELSNRLHTIPPNVSCPELTRPILDLKAQVEAIWDKKFYLERNKCLPPAPVYDQYTRNEPTDDNGDRMALAYQKRCLIDLKCKLKKKLENPKAKLGKRQEWESKLAQCELKIREIEVKL